MATPERIHIAAKKVVAAKERGNQVVVVVSAMGHTTDELVTLATKVRINGQDGVEGEQGGRKIRRLAGCPHPAGRPLLARSDRRLRPVDPTDEGDAVHLVGRGPPVAQWLHSSSARPATRQRTAYSDGAYARARKSMLARVRVRGRRTRPRPVASCAAEAPHR